MADDLSQSPAVLTNKTAVICHWLLALLLAVAFALEIISLLGPLDFADQLHCAFILLATGSTLASLWRHLPLQNVLLAAFGIAVIGGGLTALGAKTYLPFGPFIFGTAFGTLLFNTLPWAMPLVWVVVVLNSRGVARLILRPWRKNKTYGYRLIGLTAVLVLLFDIALDPFASRVKHYWHWLPTTLPLNWQGAALINFLAWALITVLILLFISPALIVKKPRSKRGADLHPLCLWLGGIILFGTGSGIQAIWTPVFVDVAIGIVVLIFAIRGAMW